MSSRHRSRGNTADENKDMSPPPHASVPGPPPMSGHSQQRINDQWGPEPRYGDGRTPSQSSSSQRYNTHHTSGYGGHPSQQHKPQGFSRYPRSGSMASSPNSMHYGYDPNMPSAGNRDMHPPIGSIAAELDLAAKEGDEMLHLDAGFPNAPSTSVSTPGSQLKASTGSKGQHSVRITPSSVNSKRTVQEATPSLTEVDELHRSGSSHHRNPNSLRSRQHRHDAPPYQGYHSNSSYTPQEMKSTSGGHQGNYPHPRHGSQYAQYHPSSTPSHSQHGGPGPYFYSPPPYSQQPTPQHQQPHPNYRNYAGGASTQHDGGHSGQAPYSPYPHAHGQPQHNPPQSWSPDNKHGSGGGGRSNHHLDNANHPHNPLNSSGGRLTPGREDDGVSRQIMDKKKREGGENQSPPRKRNRIGTWGGDGSDNSDKVTPEKIDTRPMSSMKGEQGPSNSLHGSPFQSPRPTDKDSSGRVLSSKKPGIGSSPLFTETPTGAYNNFQMGMDTPGGPMDSHFNFSPVGDNSLLKDDLFTRMDHDPNPSHPIGNPFESMGDHTPSSAYPKSRQRRPHSPSNHGSHPGSKLPPRSPFSNFLDSHLSPSPTYQSPRSERDFRRAPRNRTDIGPPLPPNMGGDSRGEIYDPMSRSMMYSGGRGDPHATYKNSPGRNKEPYHPNTSREDFRRRNSAVPIHRVEIGNVGIEQTKARKSLDGINQIVRAPHLNQRPSPRPSPPNFPFGTPSSNPPSRSTPRSSSVMSSGGSHYAGPGGYQYQSASHLYPGYGRIPSTTPIKPASGKENEKGSDRRAPCNCKRSRCLKLYCECFAAEKYCNGCNCHDCNNIPAFESIRNEAIKATRAKNPNAFKPRFTKNSSYRSGVSSSMSPSSGHNMGCRCKKSACLKKYCECFEAGAVCGDKCKCVDCQNFIGSQALIDRRRKIKDHRGAEFAMRSADQAWKSGRLDKKNDSSRSARLQSSSSSHHRVSMGMSPLSSSSHHHQQHGTPVSGRGSGGHSQPFAPPTHSAYSSSSSPPYPYNKGTPIDRRHQSVNEQRRGREMPFSRSPVVSTPRNASRSRIPHSSSNSKSRKGGSSINEPNLLGFGPSNPKLSKPIALNIFSYLSNDDLHNASIVSKGWKNLAVDDQLWQF